MGANLKTVTILRKGADCKEEVQTGNTIPTIPVSTYLGISTQINELLITATPSVMIGFGLNITPVCRSRNIGVLGILTGGRRLEIFGNEFILEIKKLTGWMIVW